MQAKICRRLMRGYCQLKEVIEVILFLIIHHSSFYFGYEHNDLYQTRLTEVSGYKLKCWDCGQHTLCDKEAQRQRRQSIKSDWTAREMCSGEYMQCHCACTHVEELMLYCT